MLQGRIKEKSARTIWAEYRDGFRVELRYVPREHLRRISERCKVSDWDKRTHQSTEKSDGRKWAKEFAKDVFVNWEGLTPEVLKTLVEMDEYPTTDTPFSVEDAEEILFHAYDFDLWAQQLSADLAAFVAVEEAAQIKKPAPLRAVS